MKRRIRIIMMILALALLLPLLFAQPVRADEEQDKYQAETMEKIFDFLYTCAEPKDFLDPAEDGVFPYKKTSAEYRELKTEAEKLAKGAKTDYQKIKKVAFGVADMLYYDHDSLYNLPGATKEFYPLEVLHSKKSVCAGFQNVVQTMLRVLGIPCIRLRGNNHTYSAAWDSGNKKWVIFDTVSMSGGDYIGGEYLYYGARYDDFDMTKEELAEYCSLHEMMNIKGRYNGGFYTTDYDFDTKKWSLVYSGPIGESGAAAVSSKVCGLPVTKIGNDAFCCDEKLTSIAIPSGVTEIGSGAFYGCTRLTDVWYGGTSTKWKQIEDNGAFSDLKGAAKHYNASLSKFPVITAQPAGRTMAYGAKAVFKVTASGMGLKYQWYYRTSPSGAWKTVSAASGKTASLTVASAVHNGYQYRCRVTYVSGTTKYPVDSTIATLKVKPKITAQPADQSVILGKTAEFSVEAKGSGLKYQWYYRKSAEGSWTAITASSGKKAAYSLTTAARHNGYQYKCVVKNSAGSVTSNVVTLKVKPKITAQPASRTVKKGSAAVFKVTAENAKTYQWYCRTSSKDSWKAVSLASGKTAKLTLSAQAKHNGYQYRCKVMNATSHVYTKIVTLTVE